MRQDDRVLDGLAAALAQVGRHRMGGVTEQGHPAGVEPGQGLGEFVEVVVEDGHGVGLAPVQPIQQGRDRIVPGAEAPDQLRAVVGRPRTGAGDSGRIHIDPAVGEGDDPEPLPSPPRLGGRERGQAGTGQHRPPAGLTGVARTGVPGKELSPERAAQSVGRHDGIGPQLPRRRTHHHRTLGGLGHPAHRDAEAQRAGRQGGSEGVDQEAAVDGAGGKPVTGGRDAGPAQPRPVGVRSPSTPARGSPADTAGPRPIDSRARRALGASTMPAPIPVRAEARSHTVTRHPRRLSATAAVRPPIPPPATTA